MKLLMLTLTNGETVWINFSCVLYFYHSPDVSNTRVVIVSGSGFPLYVKETPQEILAKIRKLNK